MNGGSYRTTGSWPGIRAAVNARLEEVSFRTGMAAGAVTLLVVAAAAAAVVLTVLPSQGSPVRAAGTPAAASSHATSHATPRVPTASVTKPATAPAPRASASHAPKASTAPAAGALPGARSSQYSPDPGPAGRGNAARRAFGARARGRGMPGGRWPGRWGGSPRYGGTGAFTGAFFRPAPRGGPGMFGR